MKTILFVGAALLSFSVASAQTTKVKTTQSTKAVKGATVSATQSSTTTKTKVVNRNDVTGTDVQVKNNPASVTAPVIKSEKSTTIETPVAASASVNTTTQTGTPAAATSTTTTNTTVTTPRQ